nr:hypothetical protein [Ideonella sp. A 288]
MAERHTWPSIRDRGLFSTTATLDLFGIEGAERLALESTHRPEKVTLGREDLRVVLRDQKPMETSRLATGLINGVTPKQWYETINNKVFFWVQEERLLGLLNARPYRALEHDVLVIDTASFVAAHEREIWLCHMNSGNTFPVPHKRDLSAFQRIEQYPTKANGSPAKEVVELVVDYQVRDIAQHVIEIRRMKGREVLGFVPHR